MSFFDWLFWVAKSDHGESTLRETQSIEEKGEKKEDELQGESTREKIESLAHKYAFYKTAYKRERAHVQELQNKNHELRDEKRQLKEELEMYKHFVRGLKCSPSEFRQTGS